VIWESLYPILWLNPSTRPNPTLLLLSGDNQTLDISNFFNLHAVVLEDAGRTEGGTEHFYTINDTLGTGPKYLTVYLGDLAGETTDPIEVSGRHDAHWRQCQRGYNSCFCW
jgi:hypothetical protein